MLVCDGLKGLPEAVETVWPRAIAQTCVVHLLRNFFRCAARQDWDKIAKLLRPVYTAPTERSMPMPRQKRDKRTRRRQLAGGRPSAEQSLSLG